MFTKQYIAASNITRTWTESTIAKLRNEDGEIASWMIVLAFLVAAAVFARGEIDTKLRALITSVGASMESAGTDG